MLTYGLSFADYTAIRAVNYGSLRALATSPRHYLQRAPRDSRAMALGRAVHTAILEPTQFLSAYAVWGQPKRGKAWQQFATLYQGRTILSQAEADRACAMFSAVRSCPQAQEILRPGNAEVTITWGDASPLLHKGRIDWLTLEGGIVDLKSTAHAGPQYFGRQCAQYGYHTQLAYYCDGYTASEGRPPSSVHILAVETSPPWDVVVYRVPEAVLDIGRREYQTLLDRLTECMASGDWPGQAGGQILDLELPPWAAPIEDEPELTIGGERLFS